MGRDRGRAPLRLHILTAVTRPENLGRIAASIPPEAYWHLAFDPDHSAVGGQAVKNRLLDVIADGWVYVLDDDTLFHPDLAAAIEEVGDAPALVVSQAWDGGVRRATPGEVKLGSIDIGQVVFRRDTIGAARIPETYEGDGHFLEALLLNRRGVVFVDRVLSLYNALR